MTAAAFWTRPSIIGIAGSASIRETGRFTRRINCVYSYSGRGVIDLTEPQTSLGDISGELGWYPIDDAHRTLSVWGGLAAPTGSVAKLTGDGAWDGAVWAHGALRWPTMAAGGGAGAGAAFRR